MPTINATTPNKYIKTCYSILKPINRVTIENYAQMTTTDILELRNATPKRIIEMAKVNCSLAKKVKESFDTKYREGNYTIISIGRSVAALTEAIQDMGANTKFIPLSSMKRKIAYSEKTIEPLQRYLTSIGLTKEVIKNNPNHKFILFDYAASGLGLENTHKLLEKEELLGKNENLISKEANPFIKYSWRKLFAAVRFKQYSPVGKCPNKNLECIFQQSSTDTAIEYKSDMAKIIRKLFRFNVIDCLKNNNFEINNPELELNALKRYETQTYMNYIISKLSWNVLPDIH